MEIGNKGSKYKVHVTTQVMASKYAGVIYCDSMEEYHKLLEDNYEDLLEEGHFNTNCSNDFDLADTPDISECDLEDSDLDKYFTNGENK